MNTNGMYVDLATFKTYLGITTTTIPDSTFTTAINSACRAIDGYCKRRFYVDANPVARTFVPQTLLDLDLDRFPTPLGNDIAFRTNCTIATDAAGDGVFETAWSASDFQLLPENADIADLEARPFTAVRAIGTKTFPWLVQTWLTHLNRVQITALWGWQNVPDAVVQSTLIKAGRLFFRKDSPGGIAGMGDFGPIRITKATDPDIVDLLDGGNYRRIPILVG